MTPGLGIGIGIGFVVLIFFILGAGILTPGYTSSIFFRASSKTYVKLQSAPSVFPTSPLAHLRCLHAMRQHAPSPYHHAQRVLLK